MNRTEVIIYRGVYAESQKGFIAYCDKKGTIYEWISIERRSHPKVGRGTSSILDVVRDDKEVVLRYPQLKIIDGATFTHNLTEEQKAYIPPAVRDKLRKNPDYAPPLVTLMCNAYGLPLPRLPSFPVAGAGALLPLNGVPTPGLMMQQRPHNFAPPPYNGQHGYITAYSYQNAHQPQPSIGNNNSNCNFGHQVIHNHHHSGPQTATGNTPNVNGENRTNSDDNSGGSEGAVTLQNIKGAVEDAIANYVPTISNAAAEAAGKAAGKAVADSVMKPVRNSRTPASAMFGRSGDAVSGGTRSVQTSPGMNLNFGEDSPSRSSPPLMSNQSLGSTPSPARPKSPSSLLPNSPRTREKSSESSTKTGTTSSEGNKPSSELSEYTTDPGALGILFHSAGQCFQHASDCTMERDNLETNWKIVARSIEDGGFRFPAVVTAATDRAASNKIRASVSPLGSSSLGGNVLVLGDGIVYFLTNEVRYDTMFDGVDMDSDAESDVTVTEAEMKHAMDAIGYTYSWLYSLEVGRDGKCVQIVMLTKNELDGRKMHGAVFGGIMKVENVQNVCVELMEKRCWNIEDVSLCNALSSNHNKRCNFIFISIRFNGNQCRLLAECPSQMSFEKCDFHDKGDWLTCATSPAVIELVATDVSMEHVLRSARSGILNQVRFDGTKFRDPDIDKVKAIYEDPAWSIQKGKLGDKVLGLSPNVLWFDDEEIMDRIMAFFIECPNRGRTLIPLGKKTNRPCGLCRGSLKKTENFCRHHGPKH